MLWKQSKKYESSCRQLGISRGVRKKGLWELRTICMIEKRNVVDMKANIEQMQA